MVKDSRRGFLRKGAIFLGGSVTYPLFHSCDPTGSEDNLDNDSIFNKPKEDFPQGSTGGTSSKNYWADYSFSVNKPPYKKLDFWTGNGVSDDLSEIIMNFFGRDPTRLLFYRKYYSGLKTLSGRGIEARLTQDKINRETFFSANPLEKFSGFPNIYFSRDFSKSANLSKITMTIPDYTDYDFMLGKTISKYLNDQTESSLPNWDWEKLDDKPGFIYAGDWSFSKIKNFVGLAAKVAVVIAVAVKSGETFVPKAVSFLTTADEFLGQTDDVLTLWNKSVPDKYEFDKDKEFSVYIPANDLSSSGYISLLLGEPSGIFLRNKEEEINNFFPTEPGIWQKFRYSNGKEGIVMNKGMDFFRGNEVLTCENDQGLVQHFGYIGEDLAIVAEKFPSLGYMAYDPPLAAYPGKIKIGKEINLNSKLFLENYPEIKGDVNLKVKFEDREIVHLNNISNSKGMTFGSAFRVNAKYNLSLNIDGEQVKESFSEKIWLAKNVGKIKGNLFGNDYQLVDSNVFNIESKHSNKSALIPEEIFSKEDIFKKLISNLKR